MPRHIIEDLLKDARQQQNADCIAMINPGVDWLNAIANYDQLPLLVLPQAGH